MEDGHSRSVSRWYVAILYVFLSAAAAAAGELNAWIRNEATTNTVAGLTYAWPSSWDEPGTRRNERILFFGSAPVALCCFREREKKHFDLQLDTKPWSISPCAGHGHPAWRISRLRTLSLLLFYLIEILISFCPTISLASLDDVSWKCTYGKLLNWWKSRIEYIVPSSLWSRYR